MVDGHMVDGVVNLAVEFTLSLAHDAVVYFHSPSRREIGDFKRKCLSIRKGCNRRPAGYDPSGG
jgi:hypothetical protein